MTKKKGLAKLPKTLVKRGRRTYGAIYELPSGKRMYLAWRNVSQIYRSGEKTISDAIRKGTASWAIDEETLISCRLQGIPFVGVLLKETEDVYLTTLDRFMDKRFSKMLDFTARRGSLQRYLPIKDNFVRHAGS